MNKKSIVILSVSLLVGGYLLGRYSAPAKVVVEEKVVEKKVVEKDVQTRVVKVEVKAPDGTVTTRTEEETIDKSREKAEKVAEKESVVTRDAGVMVAAAALLRGEIGLQQPVYVLSVSKEVLGPISVGAMVTTEKQFGLQIGIRF